ncbi:hypothetical protein PC123_g17602 [Phytophthora cactorum]|nr:hypothetical protein PC123_g17602 [Phytophthora cactorum]
MDRAPPALLQDVYRDQLVAFTPEKEQWMKSKVYKGVDSQFQSAIEHLSLGLIQRGIDNYRSMIQLKNNPAWRRLVLADGDNRIDVGHPLDLESAEVCQSTKLWMNLRSASKKLKQFEACDSITMEY